MLPVVLSDGTAVNIVRRGDDFVTSTGAHVVTVIADDGRRFYLFGSVNVAAEGGDSYDLPLINSGGVLSFNAGITDYNEADHYFGGDYIVVLRSTSHFPFIYPEVIKWLCRNYGLSFSPVGLYCYLDGALYSLPIYSASCNFDYGVYVFGTKEDDLVLSFPSGALTILGCDGSEQVNSIVGIRVPSQPLEHIRSEYVDEFQSAYNTWLFCLASGLPESVFDNI